MPSLLYLLVPHNNPDFDPDKVKEALSIMAPNKSRWLVPDQVMEMKFNNAPAAVQLTALQDMNVFDHVFVPTDKLDIRLLISDMDSTIIGQECIDELAEYVGKKAEVASITESAMKGEIDFEASLKQRVDIIAGTPESTMMQVLQERIRPNPGAIELMQAANQYGVHSVLVSGGFTFYTEKVSAKMGFKEHYGNKLEIKDGKITGRVAVPVLDSTKKAEIMAATIDKLGLKPENVLAIGDGANDIPMLSAAGIGVAYRAKPITKKAANALLDHCELSALVPLLALNK